MSASTWGLGPLVALALFAACGANDSNGGGGSAAAAGSGGTAGIVATGGYAGTAGAAGSGGVGAQAGSGGTAAAAGDSGSDAPVDAPADTCVPIAEEAGSACSTAGYQCGTLSTTDNCGQAASYDCGGCQTKWTCKSHHCYHITCYNNFQEPGETDVDCGGSYCPDCKDGKKCNGNGDCISKNCSGGKCAPAATDAGTD